VYGLASALCAISLSGYFQWPMRIWDGRAMNWSKEDYERASHALIGAAQQFEALAARLDGQGRQDFLAEATHHRELAQRFAQAKVPERDDLTIPAR
jgi:hypothetical protein